MKQIVLCLCAFFGGCDNNQDDKILSSMVSPVILVGKNPYDPLAPGHPCVTVIDSTGEIRSFYRSETARALSTRTIGDTIK